MIFFSREPIKIDKFGNNFFSNKTAIYVLKYLLFIFGQISSLIEQNNTDRTFRGSFDKNVVIIIIFTEYGYIIFPEIWTGKHEIECSLPSFFNTYSFRPSEKNQLLWAKRFRELRESGKLGKSRENRENITTFLLNPGILKTFKAFVCRTDNSSRNP